MAEDPSVLQIILGEVRAIREDLKTYATKEWVREQIGASEDRMRSDIAEARQAARFRDEEISKTVVTETTTITNEQTRRDNLRRTIIVAAWSVGAAIFTTAAVIFGPIIDHALTHGQVP